MMIVHEEIYLVQIELGSILHPRQGENLLSEIHYVKSYTLKALKILYSKLNTSAYFFAQIHRKQNTLILAPATPNSHARILSDLISLLLQK